MIFKMYFVMCNDCLKVFNIRELGIDFANGEADLYCPICIGMDFTIRGVGEIE
ncbi:MAG: hypothetical protein GY853_00705 [PVC group bacterium]|nr:hypothetical protein [PVC group bacterium]